MIWLMLITVVFAVLRFIVPVSGGVNQVGTEAVWCFAKALNPPPPDPVPPPGPNPPPGPMPPGPPNATITISAALPAGSYKIVPADAEIIHSQMTIQELTDVLDRLRKKAASVPCCDSPAAKAGPSPSPEQVRVDRELAELRASNAVIVSILEKMQKQLEKK